MSIILTPFRNALNSLREALAQMREEPANRFVKDSVIQRYEYTYELACKLLKRFLGGTESNGAEIDQMAFSDLVRLGNRRGLLRGDWEKWSNYRQMRNATSHCYDERQADAVLGGVPEFVAESEFLLSELTVRVSVLFGKNVAAD
ncbi:nucleotidyltransferase [Planctomycetales bacterium]|nr:nucleotidyltransferase [Planctomycetales bacterium]GHT02023.1 nucleotidyltransferase [Planctomycetales bacterium]GHT05436.1 nucleotidyltransferase [Planctomycetales bacterium]